MSNIGNKQNVAAQLAYFKLNRDRKKWSQLETGRKLCHQQLDTDGSFPKQAFNCRLNIKNFPLTPRQVAPVRHEEPERPRTPHLTCSLSLS